MPANSRIDYYEALFGETSCQVELVSGEVLTLQRVGLGRHHYLQRLEQQIPEAPLEERVSLFGEWLRSAGIESSQLTLADLVKVTGGAKRLNQARGRPAWMLIESEEGEPASTRISDYEGRELARIVHALAAHYGWSLNEILELPPEVATAHLQECVLHDHRRRDWEHFLSEIGWQYDKATKSSHHRKLPPVPWDAAIVGEGAASKPVSQAVKDKYYPKGVIIDLTDRATADRVKAAAGGAPSNKTS